MSKSQVLSTERVDEIETAWKRAHPVGQYQCVDINVLASLSDHIPDLIATVRAKEADTVIWQKRHDDVEQQLIDLQNSLGEWVADFECLQTAYNEAVAVIEQVYKYEKGSFSGCERITRDFLTKHKEATPTNAT